MIWRRSARHAQGTAGATPALNAQAKAFRAAPTAAEARLWAALREGRTGVKFRRQQVIVGYIVDFYVPSRRLVVEVDGEVHDDPVVMAHDAVRTEALTGCGLRVLRVTNAEVMARLDEVLVRIRAALEEG